MERTALPDQSCIGEGSMENVSELQISIDCACRFGIWVWGGFSLKGHLESNQISVELPVHCVRSK